MHEHGFLQVHAVCKVFISVPECGCRYDMMHSIFQLYTFLVADKESKSIFTLNVTGQRPLTHDFEVKQGGVTCNQVPMLSSLKAIFPLTPAAAKAMPGGTLGIALAKSPLQA